MAVERSSDKKIVLLDGLESASYLEQFSPPEPDYTGYYADGAEALLSIQEPDDLWETAYNAAVTMTGVPWRKDSRVVETVAIDMETLKGVRKTFREVHRMKFGGNPPLPYSDDRTKPVEVSVLEAELAYHIIVDWVWRLAAGKARKSRRLNLLFRHMKRLRRAMLNAFPAYADALETAATVSDVSNAKAVGTRLHQLPTRVVKAMAECMTDMERNFAAMGVFACIESRVEELHDPAPVFDRSFPWPEKSDDRRPEHSAPAYARTLGKRSFRRKMKVLLGEDITKEVISAYDDTVSARRLRSHVAAACREHGANLLETAADMAAVVENQPYFALLESHRNLQYRKMDKHERFRQAVDDEVASVLCQEAEPQTEEE